MNRQALLDRLQAAEREHRVAALSVEDLRAKAGKDPTRLQKESLTLADVGACHDNLEATYLVRLFAEFETPLRLYWRDVRRRRKTWQTIGAEDLIERVGTYLRVSDELRFRVQEVRQLRNAIVHRASALHPTEIALRQCSSFLGHFLSHFPPRW
ncbi:MAG: hypothetical protein FJ291_11645 [Planctomycetes bacterium]|nr:hypothetical protein [Planctomycetota bacterium]